MNRIDRLFQKKKENILTIYFTAGYPNLEDTEKIIYELVNTEVDLIEIGMPYSDPMADGPIIQISSSKALANGMKLDLLFKQLKGIRAKTNIPLVLMGYYNQVLQYGLEKFCKSAHEVGIDGLILPDLPIEEYEVVCRPIFKKYGLHCSFLITPSTSDERIKQLDAVSSGFIYVVSSHSITGGSTTFSLEEYGKRLAHLQLNNPIQVGFGIGDSKAYNNALTIGQGGIIGSAFIKAISQEKNQLEDNIHSFIESIRPVANKATEKEQHH